MATGDNVISMRNFDDIVIDKPDDFVSKEYLYDELIKAIRRYHPSDDISMIEKAYELADKAHKDQKRKSGEPYIIHPLCVAKILADLEYYMMLLRIPFLLMTSLRICSELKWLTL